MNSKRSRGLSSDVIHACRWLILGRFKTVSAGRFVYVLCADENPLACMCRALGTIGWGSADDTDCERFCDVLADSKKLGHRLERLPSIILIKSRNNHTFAIIGEAITDVNEIHLEKLAFIDSDDLSIASELQDFLGVIDD